MRKNIEFYGFYILVFLLLLPIGLFLFAHKESELVLRDEKYSALNNEKERVVSVETLNHYLVESLESEQASFLFVGDVMLDRYVFTRYHKNMAALLSGIINDNAQFFDNFNLISVNLEGAVIDKGEHYSPILTNDFSFDPKNLTFLRDQGFNFFNIANNHLTDQGQRGVQETEKNLNHSGSYYSGCADGVVGPCSATSTLVSDIKVGMVGLSMVYKNLDMEKVNELLDNVGAANDFVVVNVHWGQEYEHKVSQKQRDFGHFLIDNGADLVIGHHPHVIQGVERYQDKLIFYSLGNFIFDQYFSRDTQEGLAVGIFKNEDGMSANLFPFQSKASIPTLSRGRTKEEQLQKIAGWSFGDEEFKSEIEKGKIGSKK